MWCELFHGGGRIERDDMVRQRNNSVIAGVVMFMVFLAVTVLALVLL